MKKKLKVTLKKSPINKIKKHKRTLKALGLTKIGRTRMFPDNDAVRGMLEQIAYMVEIEETKGEAQ
jgi:large subunit ribosomal protein L30